MPASPRRRLAVAAGLALVALALALVVPPVLGGLVDGLRALGGAGVDGSAGDGPLPDGVPGDARTAVVDRILDGDTLQVTIAQPGTASEPERTARVRLVGVDAPELDHPDRGEDCGASEAADVVEALTPPGSTVHLVADVEDRDRYDRALRGVWNAGGRFVNAELVRAGWAEVVLVEPNDRFHGRLRELEATARAERRGAWGACGGFPS